MSLIQTSCAFCKYDNWIWCYFRIACNLCQNSKAWAFSFVENLLNITCALTLWILNFSHGMFRHWIYYIFQSSVEGELTPLSRREIAVVGTIITSQDSLLYQSIFSTIIRSAKTLLCKAFWFLISLFFYSNIPLILYQISTIR